MNCKDCLFLFDDYIDEELKAKEISAISEHLSECESCELTYNELHCQQKVFESFLSEADANPVLWKNLQPAIRNERIVPSYSYAALFSKQFKKIVNNLGLVFSPRGTVLAGFSIIVICTFTFLFIQHRNSSVEYVEKTGDILTVPQFNKPADTPSLSSAKTEKEIAQNNQIKAVRVRSARQSELSRIERSYKPIIRLPQKSGVTASRRHDLNKDLLPGEQKYLETIAKLSVEVKSIEADMPAALSSEYKRNLSALDQAIAETRKSAQRYPKNQDVMNFVFLAYRGKIALLSEIAKQQQPFKMRS